MYKFILFAASLLFQLYQEVMKGQNYDSTYNVKSYLMSKLYSQSLCGWSIIWGKQNLNIYVKMEKEKEKEKNRKTKINKLMLTEKN